MLTVGGHTVLTLPGPKLEEEGAKIIINNRPYSFPRNLVNLAQQFGEGVQIYDEQFEEALTVNEDGEVQLLADHTYSLFKPITSPMEEFTEQVRRRPRIGGAPVRRADDIMGPLKEKLGDAELRDFLDSLERGYPVLLPNDKLFVYLYKCIVDTCVVLPDNGNFLTSSRGFRFNTLNHWLRDVNKHYQLIPSRENAWNAWCVILVQRGYNYIANLNVIDQYDKGEVKIDNQLNILDVVVSDENTKAFKRMFPKVVITKGQYLYWFDPQHAPPDRTNDPEIRKGPTDY
eukprot:TRINITY_DN16599_c0_g1_i1.p1 TRINITY_DN16599_c0_g1~~TRINITY_DN16599_c0_g1_i1.p1  ORF type:complete len:287 (-),score=78.55 TRINITY_DN16599_c0_g1_i1:111-971(-)